MQSSKSLTRLGWISLGLLVAQGILFAIVISDLRGRDGSLAAYCSIRSANYEQCRDDYYDRERERERKLWILYAAAGLASIACIAGVFYGRREKNSA
jgi:hypothetical protein